MSSGPNPCPGGEGRSARPGAAAGAARQDRTSFDAWYGAVAGAGPAYARTVEAAFGAAQWSGQQGLSTADEILDRHLVVSGGPQAADVLGIDAVDPHAREVVEVKPLVALTLDLGDELFAHVEHREPEHIA